ncbi:MAG: hypothetical protein MI744_06870 [Pseudomonadales bacterium]|nr:hypothetical protein [Pseudomonadales bacterium]
MKVAQLRKDIKELSQPALKGLGFTQVGELGEHFQVDENGNLVALLIEESKGNASFSISVRVFFRCENIESIFKEADPDSKYTLNKLLASETINFDDYSRTKVESVLNSLIENEAISFLNEYGSYGAIVSNLTKSDYREWITSDKVAQFKVRLGSASLESDWKALAETKIEASQFCEKPWAGPSKEVIRRLCAAV